MTAKIVFTLMLLIGVIKPDLSIKIFEFWRLDRRPNSEKMLMATRITSVLAIIVIWWRL